MSAEIDGLVYATGHYRNGILLAPVTAELICEQVASGVAPEHDALLSAFSPDRFQTALVN
jgi:glycine oxidase